MAVLILGSEGSLGQALTRKFVDNNWYVTGIDKVDPPVRKSNCAYTYFKKDLRTFVDNEKDAYRYLFREYRAIINCAANIYGITGFHDHAADILKWDPIINTFGLDLAAAQSCPYVYISSSMVYEGVKNAVSLTEDMPDIVPAPKTAYGLSKYVGEKQVVHQYAKAGNYLIVRPFNIITPFEEIKGPQGYSHVFADFINEIVYNDRLNIPIIGDGEQVRSFTWIGDVAQIIFDLVDKGFTSKRTEVNIGAPDNAISMRNLATMIRETACSIQGYYSDHEALTFTTTKEAPPTDVRYRVPDISLLTEWLPDVEFQSLPFCVDACVREALHRKINHGLKI